MKKKREIFLEKQELIVRSSTGVNKHKALRTTLDVAGSIGAATWCFNLEPW